MPYATLVYLDPATERQIRSIWKEMAETGVAPAMHGADIRPHITLAAYPDLPLDEAVLRLQTLAHETARIPLTFSYLGLFLNPDPVVFAGPAPEPRLVELQRQAYAQLAPLGAAVETHYAPGQWVPHCSLALSFDRSRLPDAVAVASRLNLPLAGEVIQLGLVRLKPVVEVSGYPLG